MLRHGMINGLQELEKFLEPFLEPTARHALADHFALQYIEHSEQGGDPMRS